MSLVNDAISCVHKESRYSMKEWGRYFDNVYLPPERPKINCSIFGSITLCEKCLSATPHEMRLVTFPFDKVYLLRENTLKLAIKKTFLDPCHLPYLPKQHCSRSDLIWNIYIPRGDTSSNCLKTWNNPACQSQKRWIPPMSSCLYVKCFIQSQTFCALGETARPFSDAVLFNGSQRASNSSSLLNTGSSQRILIIHCSRL